MCQTFKYSEKTDENGTEKVTNKDYSIRSQISLQAFTPNTALGTVRKWETLPSTCPQMLRSKKGCKTELISRKERKTYSVSPFASSQNSQGSGVL
jgi:hypothetical protein